MPLRSPESSPLRVAVLGLGAYTPARVMENAEWEEHVDTTDEWIRTRTGIERRHVAAPDETTADMAVAAAQRALVDAGLAATDLDEIIIATDTPEVFIPDTASFVQDRLGARHIPSYDLAGSGCAGFLQALDVARSRVLGGKAHVLVVGVEMLTRLMNWSDRNTAVLFGDGAGAAILGRDADRPEILPGVSGTDGSMWDILCLETGGTRSPFSLEAAKQGRHLDIVMQGRQVFKAAVGHMSDASRKVLLQNGLELDDVALAVPHQANLRIIEAVRKNLGLAEEQVYVNVQEHGNTGSASVPLALVEARSRGRIDPGDTVLLTSFGAGFHWGATVLRF